MVRFGTTAELKHTMFISVCEVAGVVLDFTERKKRKENVSVNYCVICLPSSRKGVVDTTKTLPSLGLGKDIKHIPA